MGRVGSEPQYTAGNSIKTSLVSKLHRVLSAPENGWSWSNVGLMVWYNIVRSFVHQHHCLIPSQVSVYFSIGYVILMCIKVNKIINTLGRLFARDTWIHGYIQELRHWLIWQTTQHNITLQLTTSTTTQVETITLP